MHLVHFLHLVDFGKKLECVQQPVAPPRSVLDRYSNGSDDTVATASMTKARRARFGPARVVVVMVVVDVCGDTACVRCIATRNTHMCRAHQRNIICACGMRSHTLSALFVCV